MKTQTLLKSLVGLALGGCTLFAGLTEDRELGDLTPGAGDSSVEAGGSDGTTHGGAGQGRPGGAGGAGAGGLGEGGASKGGAIENEGGAPSECTPDESVCDGNSFQLCDADGNWRPPHACDFLCDEAEGCTGECQPDTRRCGEAAEDLPQLCDETGTWQAAEACEFGCDEATGDCLACEPKAKECDGLQPILCRDDGLKWIKNGAACSGDCKAGACPSCKAGDAPRCNGAVIETCVGGFYTPNKTCAGATPACSAGVCTKCQPGATTCAGTTPQTCNVAGSAWVNDPVVKGKCGATCNPLEEKCSGSVSSICNASGQFPAGSVTGGHCGAACTPAETGCTGSVPKTCSALGQWQNGDITPGTCGATCVPGDSGSCSQKIGAVGTCAGGAVSCDGAGHWGSCSIQPSGDSCNAGNDNSCNGVPTEGCTCTNGQSTACGVCGNGIQQCSGGQWGGCSVPDSRTTFYRDGDGDGRCNGGDTTLSCGQPAGYLPYGCPGDCFDGNGWVTSDCNDYAIDGPSYGKGCCGGAEDLFFDFDCSPGWHAVDCQAIRTAGGSQYFWISYFDANVQAGRCAVHYALDFLEGVTGYGHVICRPDGL